MKVLFLDIDGVLNSKKSLLKFKSSQIFDPDAIRSLNHVTSTSECKIVISSSWRIYFSLIKLRSMFKYFGVTGEIIDKTPRFVSPIRGKEIKNWLNNNLVDGFVILDDHFDEMDGLLDKLVYVNNNLGLTIEDAEKAIQLLV